MVARISAIRGSWAVGSIEKLLMAGRRTGDAARVPRTPTVGRVGRIGS